MTHVEELQVVRLRVHWPIPGGTLPAGTRGTVVHVHGFGQAGEVEFFDKDGNTLAVVAVEAEHLDPINWRVEYDNDVGPGEDESFVEFWNVTNDKTTFRAPDQRSAEWLAVILNDVGDKPTVKEFEGLDNNRG